MGCGQSRIGAIYSKNKKNKNNGKKGSNPVRKYNFKNFLKI